VFYFERRNYMYKKEKARSKLQGGIKGKRKKWSRPRKIEK